MRKRGINTDRVDHHQSPSDVRQDFFLRKSKTVVQKSTHFAEEAS